MLVIGRLESPSSSISDDPRLPPSEVSNTQSSRSSQQANSIRSIGPEDIARGTWILFLVICGTIIYCTKDITAYVDEEREISAKVDQWREKSGQFLAMAETETSLKERLKTTLPGKKERIEQLQSRVDELNGQLETERKLKGRIDLELNRQELKKRRKEVFA